MPKSDFNNVHVFLCLPSSWVRYLLKPGVGHVLRVTRGLAEVRRTIVVRFRRPPKMPRKVASKTNSPQTQLLSGGRTAISLELLWTMQRRYGSFFAISKGGAWLQNNPRFYRELSIG